jgi:prefoldin subunit 5
LLLPTGNPGTLAEFKTTSQLAQFLLHELVHVKQTRPGSDPASASSEREAWGTWMQASYDWLTARERRLASASGEARKRLAQEIRVLRNDLVTAYADLRGEPHGDVVLRAPNGVAMDEQRMRDYLDAVTTQVDTVIAGGALTAADRPTQADVAQLESDELRRLRQELQSLVDANGQFWQHWNQIIKEIGELIASLQTGAQWFADADQAIEYVLKICERTRQTEDRARQLIRAALGAENAVDSQLVFARGLRCTSAADLSALDAAFSQAVTDAANAERLLTDGLAQKVNLDGLYAEVRNRGFTDTGPGMANAYLAWVRDNARSTFDRRFVPDSDRLHALVQQLPDGAKQLRDMQAGQDKFLAGLKANTTLSHRPELQALMNDWQNKLVGPNWWSRAQFPTPAAIDQYRWNDKKLRDDGSKAYGNLSTMVQRPQANCGDPATIDRLAAQASPTVNFARMKVAAIDELRQQCAGRLATLRQPQVTPPRPPQVTQPPVQPPVPPVTPGATGTTVGPSGPGDPNRFGGMFIVGPATMSVGQGTVFVAVDAGGRVYTAATFETTNETVVRIGSNGQAVANRVGTAYIAAHDGDMRAMILVTVKDAGASVPPPQPAASAAAPTPILPLPPVQPVQPVPPVTPGGPTGPGNPSQFGGVFIQGPATMSVGQGTVFRAVDAGGRVYAGAVFTTSDETVVRIGSTGQAVANRAGSATVFANVDGRSVALLVTVRPATRAVAPAPPVTPTKPAVPAGIYEPKGNGQPCPQVGTRMQAQCKQAFDACTARNCANGGYSGCALDCPGCAGYFADYTAWCPLHPSYEPRLTAGLASFSAEIKTCLDQFLADGKPGRRERGAECQGKAHRKLALQKDVWVQQSCEARCAEDGRKGVAVLGGGRHRCECR